MKYAQTFAVFYPFYGTNRHLMCTRGSEWHDRPTAAISVSSGPYILWRSFENQFKTSGPYAPTYQPLSKLGFL